MKIKLIKSDDPNKLSFILSDSYFEFANSLRRALITEVPVMAVDEVNFIKNSSAFYDEMIALRLGLIPLISDSKTYNLRSDCSCKGKGCAKCTCILSLNIKGPKIVTAGDLKSSDPKIKPVNPDIPIIKLFGKQELKFEAKAILGFGRDHAKWTASMASYQYYPIINLNGCAHKESFDACPKKVFDYTNKKLTVKELEACDLCLACADACPKKEIEVKGDETKFIFNVESWGQYKAIDLLNQAITALDNKFNEFKELTKGSE